MRKMVRKIVGTAPVFMLLWLWDYDPIEPDDYEKVEQARERSEQIDDWSDAVGNDDWRRA